MKEEIITQVKDIGHVDKLLTFFYFNYKDGDELRLTQGVGVRMEGLKPQDRIKIKGRWQTNPTYGTQFKVDEWEKLSPTRGKAEHE